MDHQHLIPQVMEYQVRLVGPLLFMAFGQLRPCGRRSMLLVHKNVVFEDFSM